MNACGLGKIVCDVNPDTIAFDCLNRWAMHMTVEAPAFCAHAGRELMIDLFGNEVIHLHTIDNLPRQRNVVRRNDRRVILARFAGRQRRLRIDALDQRFTPVRRRGRFAWLVRLACFYFLGRAEFLQNCRAARERACAG